MQKTERKVGKMGILKVDGGASANNLLLDFQADLLGLQIERPVCIETTALGAALLAGLCVGVYHSMDEIANLRKVERTFSAKENNTWREEHLKIWRRAVERSLAWKE